MKSLNELMKVLADGKSVSDGTLYWQIENDVLWCTSIHFKTRLKSDIKSCFNSWKALEIYESLVEFSELKSGDRFTGVFGGHTYVRINDIVVKGVNKNCVCEFDGTVRDLSVNQKVKRV